MSFVETGLVNKISICQLLGNVKIETHDKNEILIETTNEDKVSFEKHGKTLIIRSKAENNSNEKSGNFFSKFFNKGNSSIVIGNGNIVSNGGSITINGVNINGNVTIGELTEVDMNIYVPKDKIATLDSSGKIDIQVVDISSELCVDVSGQSSVEINNTYQLDVDVSGQSSVQALNVKELSADVSGQSVVNIKGEDINSVEIDISGQSRMLLRSKTIDCFEVEASGQSRVIVYGKTHRKTIDRSGQSKVDFFDE